LVVAALADLKFSVYVATRDDQPQKNLVTIVARERLTSNEPVTTQALNH